MFNILMLHTASAVIILAYVAHLPYRNFSRYILSLLSGLILASSFGLIDSMVSDIEWLAIILSGIGLFITFLFLFKKFSTPVI